MNGPLVLVDSDVERLADMGMVIDAIRDALLRKAEGALVAPARHRVRFGGGDLTFTVGGDGDIAGFRVYISQRSGQHAADQVVAAWNMTTAALDVVVLGDKLGAIRTGAIGGIAVDAMANPKSPTVAAIGTGQQAIYQLEALVKVRDISNIRVFSRSPDRRRTFASAMATRLGLPVEAAHSTQEAVAEADIVIVATDSPTPVIRADWLKPGAHVNTVGFKGKVAHEVGLDLAERAGVLATDSPAQMAAYGPDFILAGTPAIEHVQDLADLVAHKGTGRTDSNTVSLFYSMGLAGTEPIVAATIAAAARSRL